MSTNLYIEYDMHLLTVELLIFLAAVDISSTCITNVSQVNLSTLGVKVTFHDFTLNITKVTVAKSHDFLFLWQGHPAKKNPLKCM